ncbi:PREDICTED: uncharacterized protein LOC108767427 isoform X2 [Trachymyrmex cornetzi]|nr:PREDICTED: uncharacterized protein LOC108767427 isoform X2 [Trachymyrmex cornetzi]
MKYTRICGKHFEDTCFYVDTRKDKQGRRKLKKGSIPTLLVHKPTKRKLDFSEDADDIIMKCPNIASTSEELHPQEDSSTFVFSPTNTCVPIMSVQKEIQEKVVSDIKLTSDLMEPDIKVTSTKGQESRVKQKRWRPVHTSQVDMEHGFDTPRRAKRHFNLAVSKLLSYKHKIRRINQQKRRMKKKIDRLQSLLTDLKDKKMISEEAEMTIQVFLMVK